MDKSLTVRPMQPSDHDAVMRIARGLGAWFNDEGLRNLVIDLRHQAGFVAEAGGQVVGFVTFFVYEGKAHIGWLGVDLPRHHQGIGRALLDALAHRLTADGIGELHVYTLGDSVDYPPYELTRAFYFAMGFKVLRREKRDTPACPEALYLFKRLV
jgi:ribosomal protein S18 acetylase RimI-like enzyme